MGLIVVAVLVAVLVVLAMMYLVGRRAIQRDEQRARGVADAQPLRRRTVGSTSLQPASNDGSPTKEEAKEQVYWADAFDSYFTNGGLDTVFSTAGAREWDMEEVYAALSAVGAGEIVPFIEEAA